MAYMIEVRQTDAFAKWLKGLKDQVARRQINSRLARIASTGNFGDFASVGGGVSELRIHAGAGYRIYYALRDGEVVILLCGGDKGSQDRDVRRAKEMAAALE